MREKLDCVASSGSGNSGAVTWSEMADSEATACARSTLGSVLPHGSPNYTVVQRRAAPRSRLKPWHPPRLPTFPHPVHNLHPSPFVTHRGMALPIPLHLCRRRRHRGHRRHPPLRYPEVCRQFLHCRRLVATQWPPPRPRQNGIHCIPTLSSQPRSCRSPLAVD